MKLAIALMLLVAACDVPPQRIVEHDVDYKLQCIDGIEYIRVRQGITPHMNPHSVTAHPYHCAKPKGAN